MTALIGFRTPFHPLQQRTFGDVPAGNPYHVAIEGMAANEIIVGYEIVGGTEFRPSSPGPPRPVHQDDRSRSGVDRHRRREPSPS